MASVNDGSQDGRCWNKARSRRPRGKGAAEAAGCGELVLAGYAPLAACEVGTSAPRSPHFTAHETEPSFRQAFPASATTPKAFHMVNICMYLKRAIIKLEVTIPLANA